MALSHCLFTLVTCVKCLESESSSSLLLSQSQSCSILAIRNLIMMPTSTFALVFLSLCLAAFPGPGPASALSPEQSAAIDKLITEQFLPANSIPGLGLTIVHGADSLARGYGHRDVEQGLPATATSLFAVASISKGFLGLVVLRVLNERFPELGEGVLDVPIKDLLSATNATHQFMSIDRYRTEYTTMRDLLSHRVCARVEGWGITTAPYKDTAEFMYRQRYAEPRCLARSGFVYNNALLQQAGELAAVIASGGGNGTQVSFTDLLQQLFQDLRMVSTTYVQAGVDYDSVPMMTKAYVRENGVQIKFDNSFLNRWATLPGSAGVLTTPGDFVQYLRFHLNGGRVGSDQLIPEDVMKWMYKVSNPFNSLRFKTENTDEDNIYGDLGYGLSLYLGVHKGYQTMRHGGYIAPYLSLMTMLPAHNIGILTTANGPGEAGQNMSHQALHTQILNILIEGPDAKPSVGPMFATAATRDEAPRTHFRANEPQFVNYRPKTAQEGPNSAQRDAPGIYGHPTSGEFTITRLNETTLYWNYGFAKAWLLQRTALEVYDVVWDSNIPHVYLADGPIVPDVSLDFSDPLVAYVDEDGYRTPFWRDGTLDSLPVRPWDPESCFE